MSAPSDPAPSGFEPEDDTPPGSLDRALALVRFLRTRCPWDRAQTARSLIPHLLEESHEVVDAIRSDDPRALEGELGDLLLNLAFQIVIGEEESTLTGRSVMDRLERKMVRRHPHLFGDEERQDWEALKALERAPDESVLAGLASGLDPLLRAYRMQDRAAGVGFDWSDAHGALEKVGEELSEVTAVLPGRRRDDEPRPVPEALMEEIGDLIFAVVNLARLAGVHPDTALDAANRKFERRFQALESLARRRSIPIPGADLEVLDGLWNEVKAEE